MINNFLLYQMSIYGTELRNHSDLFPNMINLNIITYLSYEQILENPELYTTILNSKQLTLDLLYTHFLVTDCKLPLESIKERQDALTITASLYNRLSQIHASLEDYKSIAEIIYDRYSLVFNPIYTPRSSYDLTTLREEYTKAFNSHNLTLLEYIYPNLLSSNAIEINHPNIQGVRPYLNSVFERYIVVGSKYFDITPFNRKKDQVLDAVIRNHNLLLNYSIIEKFEKAQNIYQAEGVTYPPNNQEDFRIIFENIKKLNITLEDCLYMYTNGDILITNNVTMPLVDSNGEFMPSGADNTNCFSLKW